MNYSFLRPLAALLLFSATPVFSQVSFDGAYSTDFNAMGISGPSSTVTPAGWSCFGNLGGNSATWTNTTPGGILATGTGAMSGGTETTVITVMPSAFNGSSNTNAFNIGTSSTALDRALGTAPTGGSGIVLQLALTNTTGAPVTGVDVSYLIRRFIAASSPNELPGYWLFYSVDSGPWTNVAALNPTIAGPSGVVVPNTAGVTAVPLTPVNFTTPWADGTVLRLRWVDDNAAVLGTEQIMGLDDVSIGLAQPAPVVALTSPANGSTYAIPAPVPLAADASDDGAVAKVEFFNGAAKIGEDTSAPFAMDWTPPMSGTYSLTARATDNLGATGTSAAVSVTITNPGNIPPAVEILSPLHGATVAASTLAVTASAADADGIIAKVEFYSNGVKVGEDNAAPYSFVIPGISPGPLTLAAVAIDNDGGSSTSAEVVVNAVAFTESLILQRGSTWKYHDQGIDLGTAWKDPAYDDSAWASGPAELGYGDAPVTAIRQGPSGMTSATKFPTYYFRQSFMVADAAHVLSLSATLERDDGAIVYLNGVEVARSNMTSGAVSYQTFATANVNGADETTYFPLTLSPTPLVTGVNVIAVEVHQFDSSSSDLSFDMDVTAVTIGGNALPAIAITLPNDGATYNVVADIPIHVNATDADGSVTKVEFYSGNVKIGESTTAPFDFTWTSVPAGSYTLTAVATDNENGVRMSGAVSVTVLPGPSGLLTRGPYLQKSSPAETTVRWRSTVSIAGRVRYGTSPDQLNQFVEEAAPTTEHIVRLTGLTPLTTYYYSVGSSSDVLIGGADYKFTTHPTPGTAMPIRIWSLGDAGTANANQTSVRNAFYNWTGNRTPDFVLQLGDNAYNTGTDAEFQSAVFDMYSAMLRKTTFWSCIGNHETAQATAFVDTYPYFNVYTFPTAGECGGVASGTEHYFSFDYGNIHIISLDSMTASRSATGAMATWLQEDLASTTATWIICIFHHPPYTKGSHNSDTETELTQMRQNFNPILENAGVDLVLCGHSHSYERSYLLDGHYGTSTTLTSAMKVDGGSGRPAPAGPGAYTKPLTGPRDHFGTLYCVNGSSGQISGGQLNHPAHFISLNNLGSLVLDVDGNRLDATFIRENGTTPDTFTIFKQGAADTDHDGLPDEWEIANGLDRRNAADAALDSDGDGLTNTQEFLAGTTPTTSTDTPQVGSMTVQPNGSISMQLNTAAGKFYKIEANNSFPSGPWNIVADNIAGTGGGVIINDAGAIGVASRIYRVTVIP